VDLEKIRTDLERERVRILKQLRKGAQSEYDYLDQNPNRGDLASGYTTLGQQSALQTLEQKKLNDIERALQRMETGVYGRCADCGATIKPERLLILPTAILCVTCQQQAT